METESNRPGNENENEGKVTKCPRCGHIDEMLEVLFPLRVAAMVVPMSYDALRKFLSRHSEEFPPLFGRSGEHHQRVRLLTGQELRDIRQRVLKGPLTGKHVFKMFA